MKTLLVSILICCFAVSAAAATQEDFTITVLKDNMPVREFSNEVAIPFNTEYKLRLKNSNHRRCSATVWIDGAKVSEIGNFIIDSADHLDLERFLDKSLIEGKRFKFVPLDHPDVDDQNRAENGLIKVEFRLEKLAEIMPKDFYYKKGIITIDGDGVYWLPDGSLLFTTDTSINAVVDTNDYTLISNASQVTLCSATNAGATVPGSYSGQSFYKVDFDGGDEIITIQLRMVGI